MKKTFTLVFAILIAVLSIISLAACNEAETFKCSTCGADNLLNVKYCSNCGMQIDNESTDNDDKDVVTCSHQWKAATCLKEKHCILCNEIDGLKANHSFSIGKCSECGFRTWLHGHT